MSAENAPTPTSAPSAPASTPAAPTSLREALAQRPSAQPSQPSVPRETAPAAAPTAAERRIAKYKLDHEEKELDWDETWKDEAKRTAHINAYQRGLNADREVAREREAVARTTREAQNSAWNKLAKKYNVDVVQDPTDTEFGWKLVPRPVTTPAAPTDALTTELQTLRAKTQSGEATAADLDRISEIRAEMAEKRGREGALNAWKTEQEAKSSAEKAAEFRRKAEGELYSEIDRVLAARTKSFEGLKSVPTRVKAQAFAAAEAAAKQGSTWDVVLKAARDVVFAEADEQDGRLAAMRAQLTAPMPTTQSAPVVGTSPSGGASTTTEFKSVAEALASRIPGYKSTVGR